MTDPVIVVTDAPDPRDIAIIADGLAAYNESQAGYRDFRSVAVLVSDPATGAVVGGLYGRTSLGQLYIERFFLPEGLRRDRLGSRVLAMAEEEGQRRGCSRVALTTLSFQAPGFYLKQGYKIAGKVECDPPGATRFLMSKKLA